MADPTRPMRQRIQRRMAQIDNAVGSQQVQSKRAIQNALREIERQRTAQTTDSNN